MYLAMSRQADREGYPEVAEAFKRYAWEEAEHAAKFAELLGDCVWDTKTNLQKRKDAEQGACEDKKRIATRAKALNLDAIHDTVHEMCKDEARHGKGFEGLNAKVYSVGVILGSNEMALTEAETKSMPASELEARIADVKERMLAAGASYVIRTIEELPALIETINAGN